MLADSAEDLAQKCLGEKCDFKGRGNMGQKKDEVTSGLEEGMGRVHDPVLMECVVASKQNFSSYQTFGRDLYMNDNSYSVNSNHP